jgi:hypothetical protein
VAPAQLPAGNTAPGGQAGPEMATGIAARARKRSERARPGRTARALHLQQGAAMKRLITVLFLVLLPATAFCQSGYLGLSYGESLDEARRNLEDQGFLTIFNRSVLKKLATDGSTKVIMVDLIVDPDSESLAGWIAYFNESLTDEQQMAIFEEIKALHGAHFVQSEDENIIAGPLPNGREVSIAFTDDDDLAMLVYYDEARKELFDTCAAQGAEWHDNLDK